MKIIIANIAKIRIEEEREHVVNPQKHSNHIDYFAFTMARASVTPKDMQHSCSMHMMRMKQYKEKAMQSQAIHSTRASHHHHVQLETWSNGN